MTMLLPTELTNQNTLGPSEDGGLKAGALKKCFWIIEACKSILVDSKNKIMSIENLK